MFRKSLIGRSLVHGLLISFVLGTPTMVTGHGKAGWDTEDRERAIEFPDTANYVTIVADLHTHSVFSDGHVWPNVRVAEAQRDGLDAIAITEHLEHQPHRHLLPNQNRNSAFNEARAAASGSQLIVVSGSEITRQAPAGHINAVFIKDANALFPIPAGSEDSGTLADAVKAWPVEDAVAAANIQGAFVFWNHAWWSPATPNRHTKMTDLHRSLIEKGQLHGIEIVNGSTYNEEAHQLALDHDLAFIGTSDIHNLIDWEYEINQGGHRPVTLVLGKTNSAESLKEGLFAQRTVVWYKNLLIGRPEPLKELLEAGLIIEDARYHARSDVVLVTLSNKTEAQFRLRHVSNQSQSLDGHADMVDVKPHGKIELTLKPSEQIDEVIVEFEVMNALTSPNTHPRIVLGHPVSKRPKGPTAYHYDGKPSFTINYPAGTTSIGTDRPDQVFAATTAEGVVFQAAVADIPPGLPLDKMAGNYVESIVSSGLGSDFNVTFNSEITLKDGTTAYRSEIHWFYIPAGLRLMTQMVSAYRDGKVVWVTAHPQAESEPAAAIVESLQFD
jgi:predicted metal-dependent phosphoesterase TrpH